MVATASPYFVHPTALCESDSVGDGTRIWAFAHVLQGAVVGKNCNIGDHAFVEGGATLGNGVILKNGVMVWDGVSIEDYVFVGPGVVFTNDRYPRSRHLPEAAERMRNAESWLIRTTVQTGASIGAGAVILCGITIGRYAMIAAGALVTRDVPDHTLVKGHPASLAGYVCRCGFSQYPLNSCQSCGWTPRADNHQPRGVEAVLS
ncbi:MAG: acyltransferase [Planctomycetota bacterium]